MRRSYKRVVGAVLAGAVAVTLLTGWNDNKVQKQVTYTVKQGDTLRDISEEHLHLNTHSRRYILDFEYEIRKANDLDGVTIYPGQELTIPYYVAGGE